MAHPTFDRECVDALLVDTNSKRNSSDWSNDTIQYSGSGFSIVDEVHPENANVLGDVEMTIVDLDRCEEFWDKGVAADMYPQGLFVNLYEWDLGAEKTSLLSRGVSTVRKWVKQ